MAAIESVVPITLPADPVGLTEAARQTYVDYLGIPKFVDAAERDAYFANPLTPLRAGQFCYLTSLDEFLRYEGVFQEWSAPAGAGIPIFADEAARDAEIIAPIEGQYCHLLNLDQLQVYDGTAWVDAKPPDVFVEDIEPTGIVTDIIWADTSQVVDMGTLPFLPITGGTMTGNITMGAGSDIALEGGGIALSGGGDIVLGTDSNITMGTNGLIQFPNLADVPKINLYANTFGLGITSGSTVIFASSTVRFRQNSVSGTEWAYIDANGLGPRTNHNVSWLAGFTGQAQFRVNPATVTLAMWHFTNGVELLSYNQVKIFDYPAGVPAPWMNVSGAIAPQWMGSTYGNVPLRIDCMADGVWIYANNYFDVGDLWECACTVTWAR